MRRLLMTALPVAVTALLLVAVMAWANQGSKGHKGKVVSVVEHAATDATTDTGASGDSAGDVLTFANDVFNAGDTKKVGTDQGYCIRTVAGASYECNWTTFLSGGQVTVEGPFYDAKDSTLAITGGTGRYRGARGFMELKAREGGTKFAFVFHI